MDVNGKVESTFGFGFLFGKKIRNSNQLIETFWDIVYIGVSFS